MTALKDALGYKSMFNEPQFVPPPAPVGRTIGDLKTAARLQRLYDPSVPVEGSPQPPQPTANIPNAQVTKGTVGTMQAEPEGYTR